MVHKKKESYSEAMTFFVAKCRLNRILLIFAGDVEAALFIVFTATCSHIMPN